MKTLHSKIFHTLASMNEKVELLTEYRKENNGLKMENRRLLARVRLTESKTPLQGAELDLNTSTLNISDFNKLSAVNPMQ